MDWVDYKSLVRRYRSVYADLYSYVPTMLQYTIESYARYMSIKRSGVEEWKAIRQYGIFLYHFAELQNLTTGYITQHTDTNHFDWDMTKDALCILRCYEEHNINDTEMMNEIANWSRKWYPFVSLQSHFIDGMIDNRVYLKEKEHKNSGI